MRRVFASAVAMGLGVGAVGCGGQAGGGAFVDALPTPEQVAIAVPTGSTGAVQGHDGVGASASALLGATAELYQVTLGVANAVNGGTLVVLGALRAMTDAPPTTMNHGTYTWGPVQGLGLDPLHYRLVVDDLGDRRYAYTFEAALKDDYLPLVDGETSNVDGRPRGSFTINWDNRRQLLPSACEQGTVVIAYEDAKGQLRNRVTLDHFANANASNPQCGHEPPGDAAYEFVQAYTGEGSFLFRVNKDMVPPLEGQASAEEQLTIRSRWDATHAGRADFRIEGGDVTARLAEAGLATQVTGLQCWDGRFQTVYQSSTPAELHVLDLAGDINDCIE